MGVNMYNSEGYYDPTAYEALMTIEKDAKALMGFDRRDYLSNMVGGSGVCKAG